jgi:REP element-mobilizing transposase RayT
VFLGQILVDHLGSVPRRSAMSRRPRFDFPGTTHHVCIRGVEKRPLFLCDDDHLDLLRRFSRWLVELDGICLAWSLDHNHAHFVIVRGKGSLASLMANATSAFALQFNRRYGRVGHLLQGRYESRLIEGDEDLRWMIVYALGNAVRHGVVTPSGLEDDRWSGYAGVMGKRPPFEFESCALTLRAFDDRPELARMSLRGMIESAHANQWRRRDPRLDALLETVCAASGIPAGEICGRSRSATRARDELAARAISELGLARADVANFLGLGRASVHRSLDRHGRRA